MAGAEETPTEQVFGLDIDDDDDFVDPWNVRSKSSKGVDYDKLISDYLPDCRVRTEEDSYCEDDCHVLNEGKLVGCPTVVPRLMKYCLGGTTYVHAISNFFMQYTMRSCPQRRIGLLRTLCNWVGPKRRLLYEPAWRGQSHWSTRL